MSRPATSRLKANPPLGARPTLEWCRLTDLTIDASYQRSIQVESSQALIRRIAAFWDWSLCQPLAIARRLDVLKVVDGQHRLEAARLRGDIDQLPCVITQYANAGEEAAAFVALNQQRRPLTALDLFKAAVAAEDESALAILKLIKDNGLQVAPHSNYIHWKPGMVSNIPGIKRSYRVHGERITGAALEALSRGFQGQVLRYAGTVFPGLCDFIAGEVRAGRQGGRTRMAETLGALSQKDWKALILAERSRTGVSGDVAARLLIAARYVMAAASGVPVTPESGPVDCFPGEVWCSQCDQRVSVEKAGACTSPFCKAKAVAA